MIAKPIKRFDGLLSIITVIIVDKSEALRTQTHKREGVKKEDSYQHLSAGKPFQAEAFSQACSTSL